MKIIGKTSSAFLVEASADELAQILGFSGQYALKDRERTFGIGTEIKMSELWHALAVTRDRKREVAALATGLRKLADRVDAVNKTLAAPIVETPVQQ